MTHYRLAQLADIPGLMEIREAVRENRLVHLRVGHEDYVQYLSVSGRTWVCEVDGHVVAFVCGRPATRDIWALFVRPEYEGRGIGSALMTLVETWMFEQGREAITLSTAPDTRAERFYRRRGWTEQGTAGTAERTYRLSKSSA